MENKSIPPSSLTAAKNELSELLNKNTLNNRQKTSAIQKPISSKNPLQKPENNSKSPYKINVIKKPLSTNVSPQKAENVSKIPYQNNTNNKQVSSNKPIKKTENSATSSINPPSNPDTSLLQKVDNLPQPPSKCSLPMPPLEGFVPPSYQESVVNKNISSSPPPPADSVSSDEDVFYEAEEYVEAPQKKASAFKPFAKNLPFGDTKVTSGEQTPPQKAEMSKTNVFSGLFSGESNNSLLNKYDKITHFSNVKDEPVVAQQSRSIVSYMMPTEKNLKKIASTISNLGGFLGELRSKLVETAEEPSENAEPSFQRTKYKTPETTSFNAGEFFSPEKKLQASDSKLSTGSTRSVSFSHNQKIIYYDSEKEITRDEPREETRKDDGCQDLFRGFTSRFAKNDEAKQTEMPETDTGLKFVEF